jgi:hypothetical protein
MIDQHGKTDLLIARLKELLPIEANITLPLARLLAEKSPDIPIPATCNLTSVFCTGDMGGIICGLDIGRPDTETPHLVSIAHLTFHRRVPLSREIQAYQRHRTKKLRQQRDLSHWRPRRRRRIRALSNIPSLPGAEMGAHLDRSYQ